MSAIELDFTGRRVLITGAASGIGAAMATSFAAHGAEPVLADINREGVASAARALGDDVAWHVYDQGDLQSIAGLAAEVGDVDILMNNAGIARFDPFLELEPAVIEQIVAVDLIGPMVLAHHIVPGMIGRGRGVVINTASQLAFAGAEGRAAYAAAKAGMVQFTKTAAAEWARQGVRVAAIAPGRTLTPLTAPTLGTAEQRQAGLGHIPAGRYGTAEEIAKLALFLASDAADYIHGATLIADGGYVVA